MNFPKNMKYMCTLSSFKHISTVTVLKITLNHAKKLLAFLSEMVTILSRPEITRVEFLHVYIKEPFCLNNGRSLIILCKLKSHIRSCRWIIQKNFDFPLSFSLFSTMSLYVKSAERVQTAEF